MSYQAANAIVRAAQERAFTLGILVGVVVVDEGGVTIAAGRMDEASAVSMADAEAKAMNSAFGRRDAAAFVGLFQSKPATVAFLERLLPRPISPGLGGVMIKLEGRFLGAVGVSGGTGDQDHECAMAALATLTGAK